MDIDFDLVNPEQYGVPSDKYITSENAK
jgi:hypothetical protein